MAALADPMRRRLVERLRAGPQPVCDLAEGLPISRPAVSQHLKVLAEAGLVRATPVGRRRHYVIVPEGLAEMRAWLDGLWDDALACFAAAARDEAAAQDRDATRPRRGESR